MLGLKRKFAWRRIALMSFVVIAAGLVLGKVADMEAFYKNFERLAAFIESLRSNRPEVFGAEEWNASVDITVTAFCNVCTYDPKNDRSKMIVRRMLALRDSPSDDSLGKLCEIWEILYAGCSPQQKEYLDRHRKAFFVVPCP